MRINKSQADETEFQDTLRTASKEDMKDQKLSIKKSNLLEHEVSLSNTLYAKSMSIYDKKELIVDNVQKEL